MTTTMKEQIQLAPKQLPGGTQYEKFAGGKCSRFVLTGPYSLLTQATTQAVHFVVERKLPLRNDDNIEHYVSDPRVMPQDQTITEILFPTA